MCFGHDESDCRASGPASGAGLPQTGPSEASVYGRLEGFPTEATDFGSSTTVLQGWSPNRVDCFIRHVACGRTFAVAPRPDRETILIVERGCCDLSHQGTVTRLEELAALRAGPSVSVKLQATDDLRLLEVSMSSTSTPESRRGILEVAHRREDGWKLYEYEALGQEVFTPAYEGGIGLLRFIFPQDEIPVHVHPKSGRIIRPISGRGYTYMHPDRCPMDEHTIAAFDANVVHTNGPLAGNNYQLWALQLPWVTSGIDTLNIAGHEDFVRYVKDVPTPDRYKTQADLWRRVQAQAANEGHHPFGR